MYCSVISGAYLSYLLRLLRPLPARLPAFDNNTNRTAFIPTCWVLTFRYYFFFVFVAVVVFGFCLLCVCVCV